MKVTVKELSAEIELKNRGIELEVQDTNGAFLGDLVITKSSLIWCQGKTRRENGVKIALKDFVANVQAVAASAKKPVAKKVAPAKKAVPAKKAAAKKPV